MHQSAFIEEWLWYKWCLPALVLSGGGQQQFSYDEHAWPCSQWMTDHNYIYTSSSLLEWTDLSQLPCQIISYACNALGFWMSESITSSMEYMSLGSVCKMGPMDADTGNETMQMAGMSGISGAILTGRCCLYSLNCHWWQVMYLAMKYKLISVPSSERRPLISSTG